MRRAFATAVPACTHAISLSAAAARVTLSRAIASAAVNLSRARVTAMRGGEGPWLWRHRA